MQRLSLSAAALAVLAVLAFSPLAHAQQGPGWFVPKDNAAGHPAAHNAAPRSTATPEFPPPPQEPAGAAADEAAQSQQVNVPMPPTPELPPLPHGAAPPAAVIGVLGVPEVMHASTAAQQVEQVFAARRQKLNEDAQKEQGVWRDMQQALAAQRASLSPDQIRVREKELQDRITNAQKVFRDRNRIIQEAAQYSLGQIERTLIGVIRQVSESRGMNLVLHRSQVALNVNEFDITKAVTEQINKVLPAVQIPADGVSVVAAAAEFARQAKPGPRVGVDPRRPGVKQTN